MQWQLGESGSVAHLMKIICWNMEHKRASWSFLHERHGDADAALLQEACTPPHDIQSKLDVGPGPWIHKGWNGARAVVGVSGQVKIERIPVSDIIESAAPNSVIASEARLAVAIATLPGGERIILVSIESAGRATDLVPGMLLEIQRHCGTDLPYIVGADLTTWWDSDTGVFGDMMRIGLPLIGPHAPTFYSPPNGQKPSDARLQLDYVFASRAIAHRLSVRALNDPTDWGPSDHCRIEIQVEPERRTTMPSSP